MRLVRWMFTLLTLAVVGGGIWFATYVYKRGFTKNWRLAVMQDFEEKGIPMEFRKLTLDPLRGLMARDVTVFADHQGGLRLATIEQMVLDVEHLPLETKHLRIKSIDVDKSTLLIALDPRDPLKGDLEVEDFSTRVMLTGQTIELRDFEGTVGGLRLSLKGKPIQKQELTHLLQKTLAEETSAATKFFSPRLLTRLAPELAFIYSDARSPVRLDVQWNDNPVNPGSWKAKARLEGGPFVFHNYQAESISADMVFNGKEWWLQNLVIADENGQIRITAMSLDEGVTWNFTMDSSLDLVAFVRNIAPLKTLAVLNTTSTQKLHLEGTWDSSASDGNGLIFTGEGHIGAFQWHGIPVESLSFRVAHQMGAWLLHDVELLLEQGTLAGKAKGRDGSWIFQTKQGITLPFRL